jgi:cbb3-type cytochrome oxidase maturation protein
MTTLAYLIPVALFLGGLSLTAFLWALKSGQYEDLDGAAERIFIEPENDAGRPASKAMHSGAPAAQPDA